MKVEIKKDKCKGCELCIFYCPAKALELSQELNKRGVKFAKLKQEAKCSGCGFCFLICPDACIEIL
ncbi:MAG: 4Fe-4S binding protein [Candidatus Omnitrophota bacterium]